jgi:hypothetical protein
MTALSPADERQARAITQEREAQSAAIEAINEGHARFLSFGKRTESAFIEQLNAAREIGIHLLELKKTARYGVWQNLFATAKGEAKVNAVLLFDYMTGRNYMRLAEAHPSPITTLAEGVRTMRDVMIMAGALPEPQRGEQETRGTLGWLSQSERVLMSFNSILGKQLEKAKLEEWKTTELDALDAQLKPFEERRAEVQAELCRRSAA